MTTERSLDRFRHAGDRWARKHATPEEFDAIEMFEEGVDVERLAQTTRHARGCSLAEQVAFHIVDITALSADFWTRVAGEPQPDEVEVKAFIEGALDSFRKGGPLAEMNDQD